MGSISTAYSVRSATSGSTRAARRAGSQAADAPTSNSRTETPASVVTSVGAIPEQQARQKLQGPQRRHCAEHDAGAGEHHRAADDHLHHVQRLGTHGQAQADLARPLRRGDRDNTVDAEAGERQGRHGEQHQQRRREAPRRERVRQELLDGGDAVETCNGSTAQTASCIADRLSAGSPTVRTT